jgi:hypothetical protein
MDCRGRKGRLTAILSLAATVGALCLLEVRYRELTASYRALAAGPAIQDSPSKVEEELQTFLSPSEVNQNPQSDKRTNDYSVQVNWPIHGSFYLWALTRTCSSHTGCFKIFCIQMHVVPVPL